MEAIMQSHGDPNKLTSTHGVIPATRYGHGNPNNWIEQMERYFRDKAIPPEHQLFVASFTLDRPALTYYLEFVKICSSHTWLSFINYLTTRVGKSFDTNSEATNQGDLVGTPSSSFQEHSQEPSTEPLSITYQELHQGSALAVVSRVSAFQPTVTNTSTPLIRRFEDERWATVQRLKEERRKILLQFIPSPQTQLEDTHSKPSPLLEEIKNISNIVLAGSNNFNIVLEGSVNLFDLSDNYDSPDNTSSERFCLSKEIWKHSDQNNHGFLGSPEFYNALKLVTVAQSDHELTADIVKAALFGPAATKSPAPWISLVLGPATLNLDSMFSKAPPTSILSIHEESTWTIWVFDPCGFHNDRKFSSVVVTQQQFQEDSFFTNEEQFSTTIFIFGPGGCTISTIFQQFDTIKFETELQIGGEDSYVDKSNNPKSCTQWHIQWTI